MLGDETMNLLNSYCEAKEIFEGRMFAVKSFSVGGCLCDLGQGYVFNFCKPQLVFYKMQIVFICTSLVEE